MSTLAEIESAAEALPAAQQRELLRFLLRIVPVDDGERFPPGSLNKYVTAESDREMLDLLKGCSLALPE
jgi:hypothetical protein